MTLPSLTIQQYLVILLPLLLPLFGTSVAALLSQDGFPQPANDIIAFAALLACAIISAYAAGQLSGDPTGIVAAIVGAMTLLIQGALHNLTPYVSYLSALQSLSVVKARPAQLASSQSDISVPHTTTVGHPDITTQATQSVPAVQLSPGALAGLGGTAIQHAQLTFPSYDPALFTPITTGMPTVQP